VRLIFMGSPRFAVPTLEALLAAGHDVALVVSQPDQPAGRGRRLTAPPVAQLARSRGLPLLQPATLRDPTVQDALATARPEAIVVAAYGRLLPRAMLALPPHGCLNVHPSLLPRWRGPAPIQWALLAGDAVTGTSIILLEERMDAGPILAQAELPIGPEDDAVTLETALAEQGAALLVETLPRWAARAIVPRPQDEACATYTRLLTKADGLLNWTRPAAALANQVRACAGWPSAYTFWRGQQLKVLRAAMLAERPEVAPGTVWERREERGYGVAVAAGEGSLLLREVALAGRRPVPATAFVQGYRDFIGSQLGIS
jgi:methionyl-tRNA formyltransferase